MNIFLDDIRKPFTGFELYLNAEDLLKDIDKGKVKHINKLSLDHDLGLDDNNQLRLNGSQFVKELVYLIIDGKVEVDFIQFHTSNFIGFEYMKTTLDSANTRGFIEVEIDNKLLNYLDEIKK